MDRGGRRLALTPEGKRLAEALEGGFGQIAATLAALTGADEAAPLRITTTPSFAAGWLMPRLADFRAHHPSIDLAIDPADAVGPPAQVVAPVQTEPQPVSDQDVDETGERDRE